MRSTIKLRTHGGLGNQLFQLFFALLVKKNSDFDGIEIFHDDRYNMALNLANHYQKITILAILIKLLFY